MAETKMFESEVAGIEWGKENCLKNIVKCVKVLSFSTTSWGYTRVNLK
jgi:hypothetical protein